jgi:glutamine synthetase
VKNAKRLPLNMLDALRALGKSATIKGSLGEFVPSYLKLKHEEWNSYCRHLTQWERDATLDC